MTRDGKSHDVASGYWLMRGAGFALGSTMRDLAPGLYELSIEVAGEAIAAVPDVLVLAPGDVNRDGFFDSTDMVHMMTAGKYETGTPASADEGDVNGDGVFTSADIVTMIFFPSLSLTCAASVESSSLLGFRGGVRIG